MARLLARTAPAGLWFLAATANSAPDVAATWDRPGLSGDLNELSPSEITNLRVEDPRGNYSDKSKELKAEIAKLQKELQHEQSRIQAAKSSAAKANATWLAAQQELTRIQSETQSAKERTERARQEVKEVQAQIEAIKHNQAFPEGPLVTWIGSLPHQQGIAVLFGIAGLLSIVGPSTFTRAFLAISGSLVGGLLVGSCYEFFFGGTSWFGALGSLLQGTGLFLGYLLWLAIFAAGMTRWLGGFKSLPEKAGGAENQGESSNLREPLLSTGGVSSSQAPAQQSRSHGGRPANRSAASVQRDDV